MMRFLIRNSVGIGAILLMALVALVPLRPAQAAANTRCFAETSFCISGTIRSYWERNGGLAVFGYPITDLRTETIEGTWSGPTQWFQRDRLEDHSNEGAGVLAGRLGDRYLQLQGISWQQLPGDTSIIPGCRYFKETQFNLCEPFLSYWERNGGIERFGYPLTRARQEVLEGRTYTVQYFERRRLEEHPENAGTPYQVLLGLLGREVYAVEGDRAVIAPTPGDLPAAIQQPILDAAYAALRAQAPKVKLAVGLVDVADAYAAVRALPIGQRPIFVYLKQQPAGWTVIEATTAPSASVLLKLGVPERLLQASDARAVLDLTLAQLQDARGTGMNAYVTRPRIAGDVARLWAVPATAENRDPVTMLFKRDGGTWRFLSAGTAFPEDDLRALGVPKELWPYGESVRGPAL
jgi:hypothetical protein